jgi:hypothetical protein
MVVVLVALFVAACVLLIVAVVMHTEPGFMHPQHQWPLAQVPLRVSCGGYVPERDCDCEVVHHELRAINERLGFEMLRPAASGEINLTIGVPSEPGWQDPGGSTLCHTDADGFFDRCDIVTSNTGSVEMLGMVVQHELGHTLDLAHDDAQTSIMRRTQRPTPMGAFPPQISDYDRRVLRQRYGPDR